MRELLAAVVLLGSATATPLVGRGSQGRSATSPDLLAGQGVRQVYPEDAYDAEEQRGEEAVERVHQRSTGYDPSLVDPGPRAHGGPWIAWYGVAAMLCVGLGWIGLLLDRSRRLSFVAFLGGLLALFYVAYAASY